MLNIGNDAVSYSKVDVLGHKTCFDAHKNVENLNIHRSTET